MSLCVATAFANLGIVPDINLVIAGVADKFPIVVKETSGEISPGTSSLSEGTKSRSSLPLKHRSPHKSVIYEWVDI